MTRFIYLCDTHLGSQGKGYHQLDSHPDRLPEIAAALTGWIKEQGNIDFVLHGGDMVNDGTEEQIHQAVELFQWPVPVYLCLGNHDLAQPESIKHWMTAGSSFFDGGQPDFLVNAQDCVIHVLPNHWCDRPFYWEKAQAPHLRPEQSTTFERQYQAHRGRPQILLTHSPVFGLPPEQTGFSEPFHAPTPEFTNSILAQVMGHSDLLCVLGAHSHLNMRVERDGVHFVTASALVEVPFEFKLFECDKDTIGMRTISLTNYISITSDPDPAKSFVQGDDSVRTFTASRPSGQ